MRRSILAASLVAATAFAQEPSPPPGEISGVITGSGFTKIKIAIPDPGTDDTAREIGQTVRDDLDFSGYFEVVDPSLYPLTATSKETTPAAAWASVGAASVAIGTVGVSGGKIDLRAKLLNTAAPGTTLFDRRYGGPQDLVRRVAHQLSDDIVQQLTGQPGIASTWIAFVGKHGKGKEIYMMDYDGRRVRRITTTGSINLMPTWSPVAQRSRSCRGAPGRRRSTSSTPTARSPRDDRGRHDEHLPGLVPGRPQSRLREQRGGERRDLLLDLSSGTEHAPDELSRDRHEPDVLAERARDRLHLRPRGPPQIYVMDAEGLNVRRLTTDGNYADAAAWSPKGDKIAFASRVEGASTSSSRRRHRQPPRA
jgi:TolB protein